MNRFKKTIITAAVALTTTVALVAPTAVGAVTIEELQAQINALLAQLATLQGQQAPSVSGCAAITRTLIVGSTGEDVKCAQKALNKLGYIISSSGAGSPGNETTYFGQLTLAAVKKLQVAKFGYSVNSVGPLTRAELNVALGSSVPGPGPSPVPTGAGLSVQLASNNPASQSVVGVTNPGSALNPMLRLLFLNGDNAEVRVTGLKLKRIGISADASATNVYLFRGAERLTDGSAVSTTIVNFNNSAGLFTVPAGGSVTISVLADIDGNASETIGFQVVSASDVTTNASSVKGLYPLTGNLMTIADATLAGVNFNATTTPATADIDPQDAYTVWQNSTTVTTRAVETTRITFRKTGSVKNTDLQNFKLYVDGVQVGSSQQLYVNSNAENVVTFDLSSSPKRLEAGTRVIKLLADIVGGSSLKFTMHLWNVADATFVDTQYGANIIAQADSATFTKRSANEQTVNSGTLTITKMSDSPSGDIVDAANNSLLAKFQFKAAGEKIKVENLIISAVVSDTAVNSLRNGAVYANGVQVGSTATLNAYETSESASTTTYNFGSSLIVEPLSPVTVEVRADIFDNDGTNSINAADTIKVRLEGASTNNNGTGLVSATTLDVPSADTDANTVTVRQGTLTLSKYTAYTDHSVVAPLTDYKLGHFTLTAATSEAVNLTAINFTSDAVVTSYGTNLYVKYGTQTTTVKPTIVAGTNSWSINYNLPAGQTIDVTLHGNISSLASSGTGQITLDVDGTTASSAVTADSSSVAGQTITFTSGAFATSFDGTPTNQIVSGNQPVLAGRFKLTSSYRAYTAKEMRFTTGSSLPISSATLKDNATGATLATVPYDNTNSYFNFTGLNVSIPASTSKRVDLYWNLSVPSADASSTNVDTVAALTYVKYADSEGTESTDTNTRTGNKTIVYRTIPTLSQVDLNNTPKVANGAPQDLYKFTVAAPSQGPVDIKQFKLDLTWTDTDQTTSPLELESLKLLKDGVDITSSVNIIEEDSGEDVTDTTGVTENSANIIVVWKTTTEDTISAGTSATYTVRGTPQGFGTNDTAANAADSVSVVFIADSAAQTSGYNYINEGTSLTGILKLYSSATANASATNQQMIWSDESAVAHSASTTAGTKDWSNSYLVLSVLGGEAWTK